MSVSHVNFIHIFFFRFYISILVPCSFHLDKNYISSMTPYDVMMAPDGYTLLLCLTSSWITQIFLILTYLLIWPICAKISGYYRCLESTHTVEIDTCVWYRPYLKITSNNDCFQQKGYENINFKAAKLQQFNALSVEIGRKLNCLCLVYLESG